jgi:hypothetical protein
LFEIKLQFLQFLEALDAELQYFVMNLFLGHEAFDVILPFKEEPLGIKPNIGHNILVIQSELDISQLGMLTDNRSIDVSL